MRRNEFRNMVWFFILFGCLILVGIREKNQPEMQIFSRNTVWKYAASQDMQTAPRVALTFDDGPHPVYTKLLLEGLKKRGVKATFFVVGENIPGKEDLIMEMEKQGHLICNHTYDHCNLKSVSLEAAWEELEKTSRLIQDITGHATAYVRPPYGNWKEELDDKTSMIAVKWTLDTLDWNTHNTSDIVNKVVTNVKENDIILLHDYYQTSVEAALQIVDCLVEKGYQFVTVDELILA